MTSLMTGQKRLGPFQLLALTCPALGVQIFWSAIASQVAVCSIPLFFSLSLELTEYQPLLREYGLPHVAIAGILVSQPLAGTILAPFLGAVMDLSHSSWGRRTPMIISGLLAVIALLVVIVLLPLRTDVDRGHVEMVAIPGVVRPRFIQAAIVFLVIGLGCAIQPLQIGLRCLIVDQTPSHQHSIVGAWMTFLTSAGAIIAFLIGSMDPHESSHSVAFQGSFSNLALVAACALVITVGVAVTWASEWTHGTDQHIESQSSRGETLHHLRNTSRTLSHTCQVVYKVQACAWMTWFPLLFYTSTFISELCKSLNGPIYIRQVADHALEQHYENTN